MKSIIITTLFMVTVPSFAGLNIALDKPATASAEHSRGLASYAVDSHYDTMWNAGRHADALNPDWLKVALGDVYAVSNIVLWTDTRDDWYGYYIDYVLYVSMDDILWSEVGNGRLTDPIDPSADVQVNQSLQYIRFDVVGGTHWSHLSEMEVYEIPEPATLLLFGLGCVFVRKTRIR